MNKRRMWHLRGTPFFLLDLSMAGLAVFLAHIISPKYDGAIWENGRPADEILPVILIMALSTSIALSVLDIQRTQSGYSKLDLVARSVIGTAVGILISYPIHILLFYNLIGRYILLLAGIFTIFFVAISRILLWRMAELYSREILYCGSTEGAERIRNNIAILKLPMAITATCRPQALTVEEAGQAPLLTECEPGPGIYDVVLESAESLSEAERQKLLQCIELGMQVSDQNYFYEQHLYQVDINSLTEQWFWTLNHTFTHPAYAVCKRSIELLISLVGLAGSILLYPFIFIVIKLQDGGPVFFSQRRLGYHGREFTIWKFRTMRLDAESEGPKWADSKDARATLFGRFLRMTRLDEIPQFWNVLKGDMAFIGPRPERPEFQQLLQQELRFYNFRHMMRPGLTGWAQVNCPYASSVNENRRKLGFDLYYIKHASLSLDTLIIFRTVSAMFSGAR